MADIRELNATPRVSAGKGAARAVRRAGRVPAVIYGDGKPPVAIALDFHEISRLVGRAGFLTSLLDLSVEGKSTRVIPRDVQLDVVRDFPLHVDFLRLSKGAIITVDVLVTFLNEEECPGIKRGGVLNVVRRTVELSCRADAIPETIEVDLIEAELGDSIHISAITLPEGVQPTITDRDFTVATIAAPAGLPSDDEEAEDEDAEETGEEDQTDAAEEAE
ncbi:MAG: 50S ribosomal protein L25/general stress protein Ctc [Alphaproteobacteria bacterium]